jgi:hypothetical protein
MHDPRGIFFPLLERITPQLKELFEAAYISVPPPTQRSQARSVERVSADDFFKVLLHPQDVTVGEDFRALYVYAAASAPPSQILHLCFIDRIAYALQSEHREQFSADMRVLQAEDTPLLYQRSALAWQTHPQNYYELETMVTRVGELMLGRSLDFAWCQLAIQATDLQAILPDIQDRAISIVAEMILPLKDVVKTKDVDWLAWEDPFIENCDLPTLKKMREGSIAEHQKRLAYVIPMLQYLKDAVRP